MPTSKQRSGYFATNGAARAAFSESAETRQIFGSFAATSISPAINASRVLAILSMAVILSISASPEVFQGGGEFLLGGDALVPAIVVFRERNSLSLDRPGHDHRGPLRLGLGLFNRAEDLVEVMSVNFLRVPAEGRKGRADVGEAADVLDDATALPAVVVHESNQA